MDLFNSIKSLFGFSKSDSEIATENQDVSTHADQGVAHTGQDVSAHADHGAAHVAQDNLDNLIDAAWSGFSTK